MCKKFCFFLMVIAVVLGQAGTVTAAVIKDSADFANKYEGDSTAPTGFTQRGTFASLTTDGDVLTYVTDSQADPPHMASFLSDAWVEGTVTAATGWTVETRFKLSTVDPYYANMQVLVNDGTKWSVAALGPDFLLYEDFGMPYIGGGLAVLDTPILAVDLTDDFHTFRIMSEAGSTKFQMYLDGNQLTLPRGTPQDGLATTPDATKMWWGGGGVYVDGTSYVDYIRWDGTGGYAPIPEPTTIVLLGFGALGLLRRRKAA